MKTINSDQYRKLLYRALSEFDSFCRKNKIQYSLIGGSLIGSVREGGIIPWDDDIDVIMTKDNYQKFLSEYQKNNSGRYQIKSHAIDKNFTFPFIKFVDTYTVLEDAGISGSLDNYGIFLDVFAYNYTSNDFNKRKKQHRKINSLIRMVNKANTSQEGTSTVRKIARFAKNTFRAIIGTNRICEILNREGKKYSNTDYMLSNWPIYSFEKEVQKTSDIEAGYIDIQFGPVKAMIFKNYDNILQTTFGDYMTPPPKNQQKAHALKAYRKEGYEPKED